MANTTLLDQILNFGKKPQVSKPTTPIPGFWEAPKASPQTNYKMDINDNLNMLTNLVYPNFVKKAAYNLQSETQKTKDIAMNRPVTPVNVAKTGLGEISNFFSFGPDLLGGAGEDVLNQTPLKNVKVKTPLGEVSAPQAAGVGLSFLYPMGGFSKAGKVKDLAKAVKAYDAASDASKALKIAEETKNPAQKIIAALNAAKPLAKEQAALVSEDRSTKLAKILSVGKTAEGEKGFYQQLGQLKGAAPKPQFESIRPQLNQKEIDSMFNTIRTTNKIGEWDKISAQTGLTKLFDKTAGSIPTNGEISHLETIFGKDFTEAVLNNRSGLDKLTEGIGQVLNLPRSLQTTADLSAPFRQGIFLAAGHPKAFTSSFVDMLKAAKSEQGFRAIQESIASRPTYELMQKAKLALTDVGSLANNREEAIMSSLAERIPLWGRVVKGSNRAYTGFLNKLRADVFDGLVKDANALGVANDPKFLRSAGNYVNAATGRGSLNRFERAAPALANVFYSPRLMASRLALLNPGTYITMDKVVRKQALKDLFLYASSQLAFHGLANLAGAKSGTDPRSADFGKIKIGNTRLDLTGGFSNYLTAATRLITGETVSSTTGQLNFLGQGYKAQDRYDVLLNFLSNKQAPLVSFATELLKGKDNSGKDLNIPQKVLDLFIPMATSDLVDAYKEWGAAGIPLVIPSIVGVGVQTYKADESTPTGLLEKLNKLSEYDARTELNKVEKDNPRLLGNLNRLLAQKEAGISQREEALSNFGVDNGARAEEIAKQVKKMGSDKEKLDYLARLYKGRIITDDVFDQLAKMQGVLP